MLYVAVMDNRILVDVLDDQEPTDLEQSNGFNMFDNGHIKQLLAYIDNLKGDMLGSTGYDFEGLNMRISDSASSVVVGKVVKAFVRSGLSFEVNEEV